MAREFLAIFMPLTLPILSSLNRNLENNSEPSINRKGERGSLCLRPLSGANKPNGLPLRIIEKEVVEKQALI